MVKNAANLRGSSHLHDVIFSDRHYISKVNEIGAFLRFIEETPRLSTQKFFMMIRPRGFGISILNEGIEYLLTRDELLMDHLAAKSSALEVDKIPEYPVLHFSFRTQKANSYQEIAKIFADTLQSIIWEQHIKVKTDNSRDVRTLMQQLIHEVSEREKKPVVILVDNYDYPVYLISRIENESERQQALCLYFDMLNTMRQEGDRVKFCLLSGHTKFALTNVQSEGLPNVIDLSFSDIAATLLGFTIDAIKTTYEEDLARIAPQQGVTTAEYLDSLRSCYGGFIFSDKMIEVLCPFSVTRALDNEGELYAYTCENNYSFLTQIMEREKPDLDWLLEKDGQDQLFLEEVSLFPTGKEIGSLLLQHGVVSVNKVTFADREHSLSWRYRFGFTNVEMRRVYQIMAGISRPELKELPINTRVYDAGEEDYAIIPDDK